MISVIMLTYNREHLVERAIESILKQTLRNFELIIVDNGSSDSSGIICDKYALRDTRIRVIHHKRGNIGNGRNTGLDAARGEYIAFVDDDDYAEPDFLEFLYNLSVDHEADVAICGASDKIYDEKLVMDNETALIELMWRKRYNNGFPTKLIKHFLFKGLRFPEIGRYEDIYLMYKVIARAKKIAYHGLSKYYVYRHVGNNSLVTTKDQMITPEYLSDYRSAYRERTRWLCNKFPEKKDYWCYFDWSFQISMVNKIIVNEIQGCEKHLYEMRCELSKNRKAFESCPYILDFERNWIERYVM